MADGMRRAQLKIDAQVPGGLGLVSVGAQWNRKVRLEILHGKGFVIFDLEPLGSERGDRNNLGAENRRALCFFGATLPHLEQTGINPLLPELVINLLSALTLKDDCRNACRTVPGGEIRNGGTAGKRKDVVPFLDQAGVVRKNLAHEDAGVAVIDSNVDLHLFEREHPRIRLLFVSWKENARIRNCQGHDHQEKAEWKQCVFHECSFASAMR